VSVVLVATLASSALADTVIQNGDFEAGLDGWQTDFEGRVGIDVFVEVIDVTAMWGMSRPAGPNCAYLQRYEWYEWPPGATQYPTKVEISQAIYVPESGQSLKFDVAAMASAVPLTYHTFFEVVFRDQGGSSHQLYYIYWDLLDWIPIGPFPFNWYTDFMSEEIDISMYAGQSGYLIFRMREPSGPQFIQFIGVLIDDVRVEIAPSPPTLISPANGSNVSGSSIQFCWNAATGANNYHLQIATDPSFNDICYDQDVGNITCNIEVSGFPDDGTTFYWHVKAGNAVGWSSYSDTWYFDNGTTLVPEPATDPSPDDGAISVGINVDLSWTAGTGATSHDVYFGTSITPAFVRNQTTTSYDPCTLDSNTTYYWRIDEVGTGGTTTGIIWSFTTQVEPDPDLNNDGIVNFLDVAVLACYWKCLCSQPEWCAGADIDWSGGVDYWDLADIGAYWLEQITLPCQASYPDPCDGATGVEIDPMLSWTAGPLAISHDVHFGTSLADVMNDTWSTFRTSQPETFYDPSPLNYSTSYYWRIDEVGDEETWKGKVWGFTTGP
jgi:hypothetical protein